MRRRRESIAASLYGFKTGMIASTPAIAAIGLPAKERVRPDYADDYGARGAAADLCLRSPNSRTRVTIRWICSSVAFGCVMIIIVLPAGSSECRDWEFSASPDTGYSAPGIAFEKRRSNAALQNASG